jgi:hypothetical protein
MANSLPSPEFRDALRKVFFKGTPKPKEKSLLPIHEKAKEPEKTVGDPLLSYQAQSIYNPNLPPAPVKPPTTPQVNRGTVGGLGMGGPWGTPEEEK